MCDGYCGDIVVLVEITTSHQNQTRFGNAYLDTVVGAKPIMDSALLQQSPMDLPLRSKPKKLESKLGGRLSCLFFFTQNPATLALKNSDAKSVFGNRKSVFRNTALS